MLISLKEYAKKHGRELSGLRRKAAEGRFATAVKVGRDWMIDESEPLTDQRIKHGKYVNWRNKKQS
jgi:hypothetical protein